MNSERMEFGEMCHWRHEMSASWCWLNTRTHGSANCDGAESALLDEIERLRKLILKAGSDDEQ